MDLTAPEVWVGGILGELCALHGRHATAAAVMIVAVMAPFAVPSATADCGDGVELFLG